MSNTMAAWDRRVRLSEITRYVRGVDDLLPLRGDCGNQLKDNLLFIVYTRAGVSGV